MTTLVLTVYASPIECIILPTRYRDGTQIVFDDFNDTSCAISVVVDCEKTFLMRLSAQAARGLCGGLWDAFSTVSRGVTANVTYGTPVDSITVFNQDVEGRDLVFSRFVGGTCVVSLSRFGIKDDLFKLERTAALDLFSALRETYGSEGSDV